MAGLSPYGILGQGINPIGVPSLAGQTAYGMHPQQQISQLLQILPQLAFAHAVLLITHPQVYQILLGELRGAGAAAAGDFFDQIVDGKTGPGFGDFLRERLTDIFQHDFHAGAELRGGALQHHARSSGRDGRRAIAAA